MVSVCLLFLVEGFELWVDGLCMECGAHVRISIPLEKLIMMTPNPQNKPFWKPPLLKTLSGLTPEDIEFLKELGINPRGDDDGKKKNIN
ncbi:MAG: hypothetical protein QXX68_03445 [Candidatus Pacearchaeota archaeon]